VPRPGQAKRFWKVVPHALWRARTPCPGTCGYVALGWSCFPWRPLPPLDQAASSSASAADLAAAVMPGSASRLAAVIAPS